MNLERQSNRNLVVTPHPQAAIAAEQILRAGGNAIDAAVASMLTLCVVSPAMVGLGGYGGSMVIHLGGEKRTISIDFTAVAPLDYDPQHFAGDAHKLANTGPLSITVPAVLAGLDLALQRYGTLPWRQIVQHAHHLADEGFALDAALHRNLTRWMQNADPVSIRALLGDKPLPQVGEQLVQKDLARLIERIGAEGPAALYRGEVPRTICRQLADGGGILSEQDFAQYQPALVEPIAIDYREHRLITPPPPSGGVTTLAILKTLEQFDVPALPPWGSEYLHLFIEATKLCWRERQAWLGDPDFVQFSLEQMLSEGAAAERAQRIVKGEFPPASAIPPAPAHTANVVAADAEGNVISVTATQGTAFGSNVVIDGLGLAMNHGMSRFTFEAASPNAPAAGKRMQHNMAPLIALRGGRPRFAVGMPGGTRIVTVTAQMMVSLIDFNAAPAQVVNVGRVHVEADEPVSVSQNLPRDVVDALAARGHRIKEGEEVGGLVNVLAIEDQQALRGATAAGAEAIAAA